MKNIILLTMLLLPLFVLADGTNKYRIVVVPDGVNPNSLSSGSGSLSSSASNTPYFIVNKNGVAQSGTSGSAWNLVTFTNKVVDTHNLWNVTNSTFKAPSSGLYVFRLSAGGDAFSGNNPYGGIYLNGTNVCIGGCSPLDDIILVSQPISLNSNDVVSAYIYQSTAKDIGGDTNYTTFSGWRLIQ